MRAVIQRVKNSNVKVDNKVVGSIMKGYTILLEIGRASCRERVSRTV